MEPFWTGKITAHITRRFLDAIWIAGPPWEGKREIPFRVRPVVVKPGESPTMATSTLVICPSCRTKAGLAPGEPVKAAFVCPGCGKPRSLGERMNLPSQAQKKQETKGCLQEFLEFLGALLVIPAMYLIVGLLCLVFQLLVWSWPVWPFLVVAMLGGALARKGDSPLAKATAGTLLPIGMGLLVLCLALILLNAGSDYWDSTVPARIEDQLVHAELKLRGILSLPIFLCIVIVLAVVNHFAPRWRVMTKFLVARDWTTKMSLALLAVTSFTLGSHVMVQHWTGEAYDRLEERYRASLRTQHQAQARAQAATALQPIVEEAKPAELRAFRALYYSLERADLTKNPEVIKRIVRKGVDGARKEAEVVRYLDSLRQADSEAVEPSLAEADSEGEWQEQERQVKAAEGVAEREKARAEQAREGLRGVLVKAAGTGLSGFGEFIDLYLENLLDAWSETILERIVDHWPKEIKGLPGKVASYLIHPESLDKEMTAQQSADALVEQTRQELKQEKAEAAERALRAEMERVRIEREARIRELSRAREFRAVR